MQLLSSGMQPVRQIIASSQVESGIDQLPCHPLHRLLSLRAALLIEEHDEAEEILVRVAQEAVVIPNTYANYAALSDAPGG